jgi:ubiquinone/menaquinone biosynthesis C-methylase UbiE
MKLPPNALVLDVGSGDKPFWRADVFVDDLSISDEERAGNLAPLKMGTFVDSPAESLPFDDGTFDFVFCSHLLEHSRDPVAVVSELLRVTKADGGGYIECPNAIVEALAPFPGHRWLVYEDEKRTLLFVRQSRAQHDAALRNRSFANKVLRRSAWNGYDMFIQRCHLAA